MAIIVTPLEGQYKVGQVVADPLDGNIPWLWNGYYPEVWGSRDGGWHPEYYDRYSLTMPSPNGEGKVLYDGNVAIFDYDAGMRWMAYDVDNPKIVCPFAVGHNVARFVVEIAGTPKNGSNGHVYVGTEQHSVQYFSSVRANPATTPPVWIDHFVAGDARVFGGTYTIEVVLTGVETGEKIFMWQVLLGKKQVTSSPYVDRPMVLHEFSIVYR